jgi:tetratricopeptide (TPR) repeat protein
MCAGAHRRARWHALLHTEADTGSREESPVMTMDTRDTPVTCDDRAALDLYEQALVQYQTYVGDAIATIDDALSRRPDFALGHAFRAGVLMTFGERRFADQARASVAAGEALADRAGARERGLLAAARHLVDGDWDAACAAYDRVLVEHPRDAFALQTAHLFDFYRGDALNLRNRVSRVLPAWSPAVPGYSYVLGMHAFGLEECNQYPEAEDAARRALAIEPRDGWAVHAAVHVMEMQGRIEDGIAWLETREPAWAPDNGFAFHNWWHLALLYLDRARTDRVLELYDRRIYPERSDLSLQLVDASSLLWRLHLLGHDAGDRFGVLGDVWEAKLDGERGYYAFNDVHAMMVLLGAGRPRSATRLLGDMEAAAASGGLNAAMTAEVGLPIARALLAFDGGRYAEVIDELVRVRDVAHRFGGSHAQRDFITLTIVEAALRSGRSDLARHYLAERTVHRPSSALGWRMHARAA